MVGSRGQRNTSGKAGKVGLQEGGGREGRKVRAAAEAVYWSADSGAGGAASGRRVRNANRPTHGSVSELGPRLHPSGGWHPTPAIAKVTKGADHAGARRDFPRPGWRGLAACDCGSDWTVAVNGLPRGGPQSRAPELSSWERRGSCAEPRPATQAGKVEDLRTPAGGSHGATPGRTGLNTTTPRPKRA